jgi:hypothetical protein
MSTPAPNSNTTSDLHGFSESTGARLIKGPAGDEEKWQRERLRTVLNHQGCLQAGT